MAADPVPAEGVMATGVLAERARADRRLSRLSWLAAVALAMILGVACGGGNDGDVAGRLSVTGRAEVGAPGEAITEVRGTQPVNYGQRVNLREGTGVIRLDGPGDGQLELRVGSNVELAPVAKDGDRSVKPVLGGGDVLVLTGEADLLLTAGSAEVVVRGTAQVARGASVVVTSYSGTAEVSLSGQTLTVPALRQVVLPASGPLPAEPSPAAYDAGDSWDKRFLGDASELGNELQARSQGFSAQLGPTDGRTAAFFRSLLPPLADQPAFESLLGPHPPGETLVGAAIAIEGTLGTFEQRWADLFAFRDQGASWGLVALAQGVTRVPLVATVDAAIGRGPSLFGTDRPAGQAGGQSGTALPRPPNSASGSGGSGSPPAGGARPATTSTTVAPSSPPLDPKGPLNTGVPALDDLVNALVDTLSGLLRGLGGG